MQQQYTIHTFVMHLTSRSVHFPDLATMLVRLPILQGTLLGNVAATWLGVSKAPIMLFVPAGDDSAVTFTYIHDCILHAFNACQGELSTQGKSTRPRHNSNIWMNWAWHTSRTLHLMCALPARSTVDAPILDPNDSKSETSCGKGQRIDSHDAKSTISESP